MSTVVDVGDALELTFSTSPNATVVVSWIDPDQVIVQEDVSLAESPANSGNYAFTFIPTRAGVWTAQFTASGTATAVDRYYVRATATTGPPPFAAIGDVEAQYGSMTAAERSLAGWLLRAASNIIRSRRPEVDHLISTHRLSGDMVALAVTNMVLRVMRNPQGLRSETVGPFSRSYDTSVAAGLLVLSADEEALLTPTGTGLAPTVREFRPRASLALAPINRNGGWPDGYW
jgi:hypothetical protein